MCDREYIMNTVKNQARETEKYFDAKLEPMQETIGRIETKLDTINGSVVDTEKRVRDLEEKTRTKKLDCPYSEDIQILTENLLTTSALKEFIKTENTKNIEESNLKANSMKWIIGIIAVLFTIISILVNVGIFFLSN